MHGRTCARATLAALGFPDQAIPVGASREPVWPDGVVGSISHCGPVAAAAVAHRHAFAGLGIDLELAEPLDETELNMICRESERAWLQNTDGSLPLAKLIFSAKESIYKCVWPEIGRFVDFQDIGIRIDIAANTFKAVEWAENLPAPIFDGVAGRFLIRDEWIITTACLPRQAVDSVPGSMPLPT